MVMTLNKFPVMSTTSPTIAQRTRNIYKKDKKVPREKESTHPASCITSASVIIIYSSHPYVISHTFESISKFKPAMMLNKYEHLEKYLDSNEYTH